MPDIYSLTRKEIARISGGDQRTVRFLENLNSVNDSIQSSDTEGGIALSRAIESSSIAQNALRIAKSTRVLLWLSM